jgi:hypothetical protein
VAAPRTWVQYRRRTNPLLSEVLAAVPPMSGSHTIRQTVRGSWQPLDQRPPIDWGAAGQPRGPDGRFLPIEHEHNDEWE